MKPCTVREFARATAKARDARYMNGTRYTHTIYSLCRRELAEKVTLYKRGKPHLSMFYCADEFLDANQPPQSERGEDEKTK